MSGRTELVVLSDGETYSEARGCYGVEVVETDDGALSACEWQVVEAALPLLSRGGLRTVEPPPDLKGERVEIRDTTDGRVVALPAQGVELRRYEVAR